MNIAGKIALVTGGAHRVGKEIVIMLAQQGAHVVINYNTSVEAARQTALEVESFGVTALPIQCDVSDLSQVQQMSRQVQERFGGIDILVNNADFMCEHPFPTRDYALWHQVTDVTIHGSFYVSNEFAPYMLAQKSGVIINIVDLEFPTPNMMAHSVAKHALLAMSKQMAVELAPDVRVNAIAPGPMLPPPDWDEGLVARIAGRTLLQKWGSPKDVAFAVKYIIEADYVTGDVMRVDGGTFFAHRKAIVYT
jgi:NAD(P)-dependent dehydrogenase (short-subunit alcohol dehydrogenase family)